MHDLIGVLILLTEMDLHLSCAAVYLIHYVQLLTTFLQCRSSCSLIDADRIHPDGLICFVDLVPLMLGSPAVFERDPYNQGRFDCQDCFRCL